MNQETVVSGQGSVVRVGSGKRPVNSMKVSSMVRAGNADSCSNWLKSQGFEVLAVQNPPQPPLLQSGEAKRGDLQSGGRVVGGRNPRITIRNSPLCEKLEGAVRMYERGTGFERRYWVAIRLGCEVRWDEIPPHPPTSTSSGQATSASSGQATSTSSGQATSTSSGQATSTSSGQATSTSSGHALTKGGSHG